MNLSLELSSTTGQIVAERNQPPLDSESSARRVRSSSEFCEAAAKGVNAQKLVQFFLDLKEFKDQDHPGHGCGETDYIYPTLRK